MLQRLEGYYDQVPRSAARAEIIGPFTLFIKLGGGFPYYARPSLGSDTFRASDVDRVRERQRQLDLPESFEWVAETTPNLAVAARESGLEVHEHPLLVLREPRTAPPVEGVTIRLVSPEDDLAAIRVLLRVAFGGPEEHASAEVVERDRERLRSGLTVTAAAFTQDGKAVAAGSHQPLNGVSEVVGVGTLPAFRRRGIASALTALLVQDALTRVDTVFLSAGDDDAARIYERVGFQRLATACIAEP